MPSRDAHGPPSPRKKNAHPVAQTMRRIGNAVSNRSYNPRSVKPPIPLDVDEIDMAMERFIRQKYEHRALQAGAPPRPGVRPHADSSGSDDPPPPPLPPKTEHRFMLGSRAVSSTFPMSTQARNEYASRSVSVHASAPAARLPSPVRRNKASRVFGASVGGDEEDAVDTKLSRMKEMGFADAAMNLAVLKSSKGSLERAVATMVAMSDGAPPRPPVSALGPPTQPVRSRLEGMTLAEPTIPPRSDSTNPFDSPRARPTAPPLAGADGGQQPLGPASPHGDHPVRAPSMFYQFAASPYPSSHQGGGAAAAAVAPAQSLHHPPVFMNPHLPRPLFPHATGGGLITHPEQEVLRRQAFTPPLLSSLPPRHHLYGPSVTPPTSHNPFLTQPSPLASGPTAGIPGHYHMSTAPGPMPAHSPMFSPAPSGPVVTGRADKASILALFDQPHLAPIPPSTGSMADPPTVTPTASPIVTAPPLAPPRSVSMPVGSPAPSPNRNPFAVVETPGSGRMGLEGPTGRHSSQESVDVGSWTSPGRHSPDAFKNLSARWLG